MPDRAFWVLRYSTGGRVREAGLARARGHIVLICHRGRTIGIELKSLFGRVSAAQRRVRDAMLKAGVPVVLPHGNGGVDGVVSGWRVAVGMEAAAA